MTQSLELLLDDRADARVRAEWSALADAGFPSQAHHRGASNRPHVTLLVRSELPVDVRAELPIPILLGSPLVLGAGDRRAIARLVVPSPELLDLHRELHRAVGPGDDAPFTAPRRWTPHVTLARRVPLAEVGRAVGMIGGEVVGSAVGLRRWDGVARAETRVV